MIPFRLAAAAAASSPAAFRRSSQHVYRSTPPLMRTGASTGTGLRSPFSTSSQQRKDELPIGKTDPRIQIEQTPPSQRPQDTVAPARGAGGPHSLRTLPTFSLEGRVAVVTGGARGLGLVMAQGLVYSGCDVALVDLTKEEAQKQAKSLVEQFMKDNPEATRKPKITAHYSDVSNPESVSEALNEIISEHGQVDHLVTSAGFTENFDAVRYPHDRMKKLWGVNVDGTWLFAVGVAKHLMERNAKGSMVLIGSMSSSIVNVPQPQAPYNASKAAVRHLAASFAVEWATNGIRVNCISPGYMRTALTDKIIAENPDLGEKWTSLIPSGRMGVPQDLMGAVVFLLSDAAGYVTGAELRVDGAYTAT